MLVIYAKYKENRMEIAGVSNPLFFEELQIGFITKSNNLLTYF